MTTISVPLSPELMKALQHLIDQGVATNKADVLRKALKFYSEQQAVEDVLRAMGEPRLSGDLDELAAQLR